MLSEKKMLQVIEWKSGVPPVCDGAHDCFYAKSKPLLLLMEGATTYIVFGQYLQDEEGKGKYQTLCASAFEIKNNVLLYAEVSEEFIRDEFLKRKIVS